MVRQSFGKCTQLGFYTWSRHLQTSCRERNGEFQTQLIYLWNSKQWIMCETVVRPPRLSDLTSPTQFINRVLCDYKHHNLWEKNFSTHVNLHVSRRSTSMMEIISQFKSTDNMSRFTVYLKLSFVELSSLPVLDEGWEDSFLSVNKNVSHNTTLFINKVSVKELQVPILITFFLYLQAYAEFCCVKKFYFSL